MSSIVYPVRGEPAPSFILPSASNPHYNFDSAAGRYLVLCFFHSAADPGSMARVKAALARPDIFNDSHVSFFGLSTDPEDRAQERITNRIPGYRILWDHDCKASRLYGAVDAADLRHGLWAVTDPRMRLLDMVPFREDGGDIAQVLERVAGLPPVDSFAGTPLMAPILFLPDVFEPALCQHLIGLYKAQGGEESGVMREIDGRTVGVNDRNHKSRKDITLTDQRLIAGIQTRIIRRVVPEIRKAHQFEVTRMERYIVSCYAAEDGGHFSPHRDNTTSGTAHRRFAVSINLNADFEGGEVGFPEYGPRRFKAPPGGAVVFSCSLLHSVSKVTAGRRYAFLPFLYDEAAAKLREANRQFLGEARAEDGGTEARPAAPL